MKSQVIASLTAGVLLISAGAQAADLGIPASPMAPPPPAVGFSWTGLYLGLNGGYDWSSSHWQSSSAVFANPSGGGVLVGGQIGYNYEFPNAVVVGIEGMLDWTNLNGTGPWSTIDTANYQSTYLGAVRGRLGYAFGSALLFAEGGAGFANFNNQTVPCCTGFNFSAVGWTVGGGVEYALSHHWTVRAQYDYYNFGSQTASAGALDSVPTTVSPIEQTATVAINYKF